MAETADAPEPLHDKPRTRRIIAAAVVYFAIVFAVGLILGPVRALWLEPLLGAAIAVIIEAPFLLAAMGFAARHAPRWAGMRGPWIAYLAVGLLALALQQIADLGVGFGLRGMTLAAQLEYFTTPPGWIYAGLLAAFAFMPLIAQLSAPRRRSVD